jgi:hypothetical protein
MVSMPLMGFTKARATHFLNMSGCMTVAAIAVDTVVRDGCGICARGYSSGELF